MIRAVRPGDAVDIAALHATIVAQTEPVITFTTDARSVDDVHAQIEHGRGGWVTVDSADRVLGFANWGPFRSGPGYARTVEHSILLAPEARGRGLGRGLMSHLERQALSAGLHVLIAAIGGENLAAQTFHSRLGFEEVGRLAEVGFKDGRWQTLVLMQKRLSGRQPAS